MKIDTEILCSFIDGELDAATAAAVRAALDRDENLRQEYEDLRKTAELVRGLPKVSAPPELVGAITANAERDQLLGRTSAGPTGRPWLYWGLSVAASLLVGVTVGIVGYHNLREVPKFSGGLSRITIAKDESGAARGRYSDGGAEFPERLSDALALDKRDSTRRDAEDITMLTKSDGGSTAGKGGIPIARTGPKWGAPAGSSGGPELAAEAPQAESESGRGLLTGSLATAEESQQEPAAAKESEAYLAYGMKPQAKGAPADVVVAGDLEAHIRRRAGGRLPLEPQVRTANFVNQDMAVNLDFEAEPVNVKVVSNDTSKTLQYVHRWAADNSLVDLNTASPEVNFPVYTQVFYQGIPGANISPVNEKGVLLRTTRGQAQQIVSELERQRPTVVSVAVKDEKDVLGLDVKQLERTRLGATSQHGLGEEQGLAVQANEPIVTAPQEQRGLKEVDRGNSASGAFTSGRAVSKSVSTLSAKARTEYYLSQITNQAQALSLDDLVTLVVMVTDARDAASAPTSSPTVPPPAEPEATESK